MIINFDSITLLFLVVAAVTLAVVSVLVWYVYSSKKFRKDIIELMDEKLEMYLDNLDPPKPEEKQEEEITAKNFVEKDLTHSIEEISKFPEEPQSFVEKPQ